MVASDMPWYAPCSDSTSVRPVTRMASLTAASIASPPPARTAILASPSGVSPASRVQYATSASLWCRMFVVGSVAICRATASATRGLAWPTIAGPAEPDIVSRYMRPSASHTRAFSPRTSVRHGSRRRECSTNRLSASTSPLRSSQVRSPRAATFQMVSTRPPRTPTISLVRLQQVQAWNG
jgi:hypothetical protein